LPPQPEGEELFFQGPAGPGPGEHDGHELHFEEHRDQPISKAAWVTAAFLGALVVGGGLYWGLRDTVEPIAVQPGVLEQNWHEQALKTRGPAPSAPALDAGFAAVHEAPPPAEVSAPASGAHAPASEAAAEAPPAPPPGPPSLAGDTPPTEPAPAAQADFRRLLDEGLALHGKRKYREAAEKLERALALATGNATVLLAYAQTLMELDRGAEALRAAEKCAAIAPNNARAWLIIGSVKQDKGDLAGAKAAYAEYIKLAPTDRYAEDVRRVIENIQ
jgi:tetratricopeptide (TPR) repeat protein